MHGAWLPAHAAKLIKRDGDGACVLCHAGVPHANIQDGADPWRQGGAQQVLPLRPFPLRPGGGLSRSRCLLVAISLLLCPIAS
jgi:hypothetical protein